MNRSGLSRPKAQRSECVVGGGYTHINHIPSMLLTCAAIGRLGVRPQQEHPLQRPLVDGGLNTQVNKSPWPEGSTNNNPSITKSTEWESGWKTKKQSNNKHLFTVALLQLFLIYDTVYKAWVKWIGSCEFKRATLSCFYWKKLNVMVWKVIFYRSRILRHHFEKRYRDSSKNNFAGNDWYLVNMNRTHFTILSKY